MASRSATSLKLQRSSSCPPKAGRDLEKAAPEAHSGTRIVSLEITLDGHRYGEWFDFVVGIVSNDATKR